MDIIWNVQVEYFVLSCGGCGWISLDNSAHVCHWYCREIHEGAGKRHTAIVVVARQEVNVVAEAVERKYVAYSQLVVPFC